MLINPAAGGVIGNVALSVWFPLLSTPGVPGYGMVAPGLVKEPVITGPLLKVVTVAVTGTLWP